MRQLQKPIITKNNVAVFFVALVAMMITTDVAHARQEADAPTASDPCVFVKAFSGVAQVFDDTRTHVVDIAQKKSITCGSWVSVEKGWVSLHHRDGYSLKLVSGTFVQLPEVGKGGDPVVLFRGQLYGQSGGATEDLRVLTPNARASVNRGAMIVSFEGQDGASSEEGHAASPEKAQQTQVVAVEGKSTLENRFESGKKMVLKAGDFSTLDFKLIRVIPSVPKPISTASLKEKLQEFHLPVKDRDRAIASARSRQKQTFAAAPVAPRAVAKESHASEGRTPASSGSATAAHDSYPATEDEGFEKQMVNHMTAGEPAGARILFPNATDLRDRMKAKSAKRFTVEVDPAAALRDKENQAEAAERRKIIEELNAVHSE